MRSIKFEALEDEILEVVVKYLTLVDRVRFERVDKRWSHMLSHQWSRQSTLLLICVYNPVFKNRYEEHQAYKSCPFVSHHVRDCDIFRQFSDEYIHESFESRRLNNIQIPPNYSILQRCPNLKALYWGGMCPQDFGTFLSDNCPKLKHLAVYDDQTTFMYIMNYEFLSQLKCLVYFDFTFYDEKINAAFLRKCTNLEVLNTHDISEYILQVALTACRLSHLRITNCNASNDITSADSIIIDTLIKHGVQLKSLSIKGICFDSDSFSRLCEKLQCLEKLYLSSLSSTGIDVNCLKSLHRLNRLKLDFNFNIAEQAIESYIVDNTAHRLKSLSISEIDHSLFIKLLAKASELEKLTIRLSDVSSISKDNFPTLSKLTTLKIIDPAFTAEILSLILPKCVKLEKLVLHMLEKQVVRMLQKYAKKYYKRRLRIWSFGNRTAYYQAWHNLWVYVIRD